MKLQPIAHRNFLFLQGPPGPFFFRLAKRLGELGFGIRRINLNAGDAYDWPAPATSYRGRRRRWALFIDGFMADHAITDLVLFGDCRPMHMAAHQMAKLRGIRVHVFEEGYVRPDWVTLEEDGVNGRSLLPRDPAWYLAAARRLPPLPENPPITASFRRRGRDVFNYYARATLGRPAYPFFRSHRRGSLLAEGALWLAKLGRRAREEKAAGPVIDKLAGSRYFLFPLQLSSDYQIREHSPFQDMVEALDYVLYSFARRAPDDVKLVIKEHPLDPGRTNWCRLVHRRARQLGLGDRLVHVAGGDLAVMTAQARGMITVNSTSATLALNAGVPTIVLGTAIYHLPGLTHQGRLDNFWSHPTPPQVHLWDAFRRVLHDRCLIYGGFASESAVTTLVESAVERLMHAGDRAAAAEIGQRSFTFR